MKPSALHSIRLTSAYTIMLKGYRNSLETSAPRASQHQNGAADAYLEKRVSLAETGLLLDELALTVGHRGFGLDVGARIHPSDFGIMGYLLMNCSTLLQACEYAARYKGVMNEGLSASVLQDGEKVTYTLRNLYGLEMLAPMIELDLASALHFAKLLVGPHLADLVQLQAVTFEHGPLRPALDYEQIFGCPVFFHAGSNSIQVSHSVVDHPVYGANPKLFQFFESRLIRIEDTARSKQSLRHRVYNLLCDHQGSAFPDLNRVAEHFHMSISAFKKHLQQEDTCFQQIQDEVRALRAHHLITNNQISLKAVAFALGYTSNSAFVRAFRRWHGMSPSEYRRMELADPRQEFAPRIASF